MFRRRRQREQDEIMFMHAKIAAIHADMVRRDEELRLDLRTRRDLIDAVDRLTHAVDRAEARAESEASLATVLRQMLTARNGGDVDFGGERVLGGSVGSARRSRPQQLEG